MIPEQFRNIYPNPVQHPGGIPAVIFRDHRWTLPVLRFASEAGLLRLPSRVVTFDRHCDSLVPKGDLAELARLRAGASDAEFVGTVARRLSPRDDDWIIGGMELGLISDVMQFRTEADGMEGITRHTDARGTGRRIFHLERPSVELAWKGALVDAAHPAAREGLWDVFGWDPEGMRMGEASDLAVDIDLDFFTICWETHVFPFPDEVYEGEFLVPRPSGYHSGYPPVEFLRGLMRRARVLTIACEPDFCGGERKTRTIMEAVNRLLPGKGLEMGDIRVDYPTEYPVE